MVRRIIWDMSLRSEGHTHNKLELRDLWLDVGLHTTVTCIIGTVKTPHVYITERTEKHKNRLSSPTPQVTYNLLGLSFHFFFYVRITS